MPPGSLASRPGPAGRPSGAISCSPSGNICAKLAKACAAGGLVTCHYGSVKKAYLEALAGHRGEIKRKWEVLLRAAPATTPLGNPDTLVYLMDESIQQLFSLFRSRSAHDWLVRHPPATRLI